MGKSRLRRRKQTFAGKIRHLNFTNISNLRYILGKPSDLYNVNDPDCAPTLNMGHDKIKSPSNDDLKRTQRTKDRAAKRARLEEIASNSQVVSVRETIVENERGCTFNSSGGEFEVLKRIDEEREEFPEEIGSVGCQTEWLRADKECQTDLSMTQIYQLEECNRNLFTELNEVKNKLLASDLSEGGFEGNDEKTQFYTGIYFQHL